jgi:hypothetical protein
MDGTGVRALHPIQAVAAMLPKTTSTEESAESQLTS